MPSDGRIKTIIFPQISVGASGIFTATGSVITPQYSSIPVNGEIIKVLVQNPASPGSIWFAESGGAIMFTKNNVVSGTNPFEWYPRPYLSESTGNAALVAGSWVDMPVCMAPIYMAGSGFTSGTANVFGPITVYYR